MALSANLLNKYVQDFMYREFPVKAGAIHIYNGANLNIDATGYAKLGSDTASEVFVGVADAELDQAAGGSNGDNVIRAIAAKSGKLIKRKLTGVTQADIYKKCYVVDDETVALTTTNSVEAGTIIKLAETNYCYIALI